CTRRSAGSDRILTAYRRSRDAFQQLSSRRHSLLIPFAQQLIAVITFCCQFATFLLVPESTQQLPLSRRVRLRSAPVALSASNRASLFCSDGRRNSDRSTRRLHFAGTLKTANCVHVMLA